MRLFYKDPYLFGLTFSTLPLFIQIKMFSKIVLALALAAGASARLFTEDEKSQKVWILLEKELSRTIWIFRRCEVAAESELSLKTTRFNEFNRVHTSTVSAGGLGLLNNEKDTE